MMGDCRDKVVLHQNWTVKSADMMLKWTFNCYYTGLLREQLVNIKMHSVKIFLIEVI